MPCGATANLIEVRADGSVRVSGTYVSGQGGTPSVQIPGLTVSKAATFASPNWSVVFSGAEITGDLAQFRNTYCDRSEDAPYTIRRPPFGLYEFPCEGSDVAPVQCPGACPKVEITITPGNCVAGRRTVHFRAELLSADEATYTWFFGTDEDNQPGEDSQGGDWLPVPDPSGVRVIEVGHVYEATGDQTQTITVKLETSAGPNADCVVEQTFALEPCDCDLTVSLQVLSAQNPQGPPIPTNECVAPGNYFVEVTSPASNNNDIEYSWSVNGTSDDSQSGATFDFAIVAGEQKSVTVYVEQGACDGSNGVIVAGCEDCSDFDAQIRVLDANRRNVTDENCLPPGNYTVQSTSPTGAGNAFSWSVNNVIDTMATGPELQVNLGNNDQKIVTLVASRGECSDPASVVLQTCDAPPPVAEDFGCLVLRELVAALAALGILTMLLGICFSAQPMFWIGMGIAAVALILLVIWLALPCPRPCAWGLLMLAQIFFGIGWGALYFILCCPWLGLLGFLFIVIGAGLFYKWYEECQPTVCRVFRELAWVVSVVVAPVVSLLFLVPALQACGVPIINAILTLATAAIVATALTCSNSE